MRSSFNQSILSRINSSLPHHPNPWKYIYILGETAGWRKCRCSTFCLFIYFFAEAAQQARASHVCDWSALNKTKNTQLIRFTDGRAVPQLRRENIKNWFSISHCIHSAGYFSLLSFFFPPSSLFQGFDEAFKCPLLSVGAGEVGTPSPHGPKGTSPTRIRKHFHDCFIHNAPSNGIVWFHACYLRLGWSEPWHSVIGLADPCTAGGIIQPRNLIWFGKDQGMWFDGSYLFFVLDREKVKKRREKKKKRTGRHVHVSERRRVVSDK